MRPITTLNILLRPSIVLFFFLQIRLCSIEVQYKTSIYNAHILLEINARCSPPYVGPTRSYSPSGTLPTNTTLVLTTTVYKPRDFSNNNMAANGWVHICSFESIEVLSLHVLRNKYFVTADTTATYILDIGQQNTLSRDLSRHYPAHVAFVGWPLRLKPMRLTASSAFYTARHIYIYFSAATRFVLI